MPKTVTRICDVGLIKAVGLTSIATVASCFLTLSYSVAQSPIPYKINPFPTTKTESSSSQKTIGIKHFRVPVQEVPLKSLVGKNLKSKKSAVKKAKQPSVTHRRGPTRRGGPVRNPSFVKKYPAPVGPLPFQRLAPPSAAKQTKRDVAGNTTLPEVNKHVWPAIPNVPEDVMEARPAKKRVLTRNSPIKLPELQKNVAVKSTLKPQPLASRKADDAFDSKEWVAFQTHKPPAFFTGKTPDSTSPTQESQEFDEKAAPHSAPPVETAKTESYPERIIPSQQDTQPVEQSERHLASLPRRPTHPETFPPSEHQATSRPQPAPSSEVQDKSEPVPSTHSEDQLDTTHQEKSEGDGWIKSIAKRVRNVFRSKPSQPAEDQSGPIVESFPTPPMTDRTESPLPEPPEANTVEPPLEMSSEPEAETSAPSSQEPEEPGTSLPSSVETIPADQQDGAEPPEIEDSQPQSPPDIEPAYPKHKSGLASIGDRIRNIFKKKPTRVLAQADPERTGAPVKPPEEKIESQSAEEPVPSESIESPEPTQTEQVAETPEQEASPEPTIKPAVVGPDTPPVIAPSRLKEKKSWLTTISERIQNIVYPRKTVVVRELPAVEESVQDQSPEEESSSHPSENPSPAEPTTTGTSEAPDDAQAPQEVQPDSEPPSNGWPNLAGIPAKGATGPSSEPPSVMEPASEQQPTEKVGAPPSEQHASTPAQPGPESPEPPMVASPLNQEAAANYQAKRYLEETAPILEKVSLLITRSPSMEIEDYDPSDPDFTMVSQDVLMKMESMKRDLQIIDAKTFNIIPPSEYGQFHSMIRDSISHTHQACDAIMGFLKDGRPDQLPAVQDHLIRARKLIQRARESAG